MSTGKNYPATFDRAAFAADVEAYRERQSMPWRALAEVSGVHYETLHSLGRRGKMALETAVALAWTCDLRLEDYVTENVRRYDPAELSPWAASAAAGGGA